MTIPLRLARCRFIAQADADGRVVDARTSSGYLIVPQHPGSGNARKPNPRAAPPHSCPGRKLHPFHTHVLIAGSMVQF